ncbi:MAG TPA: transposase [Acidimicrobiales bacterium]
MSLKTGSTFVLVDPSEILEALVGLKDVEVVHYKRTGPDVELMVEQVPGDVRCPECNGSAQVKERPVVHYVDLPVYGTPMSLAWKKHRMRCVDPGCAMKTWTLEDHRIAAKSCLLTTRAAKWATAQVGGGRTVSEVADELACDWHTVNDAVTTYGTALLAADRKRLSHTSAIGLDETSFIKLKEHNHPEFVTTVADVEHHQIIDILPTRTYVDVAGWIDRQSPAWKERIVYGALDMSRTYAAVYSAMLPNAAQVVDDAASYEDALEMVKRHAKVHSDRAKTVVSISAELRVYSPHSPHSFYLDTAERSMPGTPANNEAVQRLERYAAECKVESGNQGPEGKHLRQSAREYNRTAERRSGMDTTSGSDGSFVTPVYLMQPVGFLSPERAFTNQCNAQVLPEYGLSISVPSFTSTGAVGQQAGGENTAVGISSPSGARLTANLVSISGSITISQQLADRSGSPGVSADAIIQTQLEEQLDAAVDAYVLGQVIAGAGTITDTGSFSIPSLYGDLRSAREQMANTAGFRRQATHLFSTSNAWGATTDQVDTAGRPLIVPSYAAQPLAALAAASSPKAAGWTGHQMPGSLNWFVDDSIPTTDSGAETRLLVARPNDILTWIGAPLVYAFPKTNANDLSVVVGLRAYVAVLSRHSAAVQSISGAAYPVALA